MQKSTIWLLAFLPYLHWFGSLVDGATVLTSPASPIRIFPPGKINVSNGLPPGLIVVDKERGPELPAVDVFEMGLLIISLYLAREDFYGFMLPQAWSLFGLVLGVSLNERQENTVQRAFVILGIYFIFLLMKNENDFRSGVFEIQYDHAPICDIVIFSAGSSGLNTQPSFTHVTQLAPPPSPIAYNTNSSSELVVSTLGFPEGLFFAITPLEPFQPLDQLNLLISLLDVLVTGAQPPEDERVQNSTESTVSGVKTSISPVIDARPPNVMTYEMLILAAWSASSLITDESQSWSLAALRIQFCIVEVYVGEITIVPSNSSAPTIRFSEANVNASAGTATARKKRGWINRKVTSSLNPCLW